MLCTIWWMKGKATCVTEWLRVHGWTFWKVLEGTGLPERLPDLGLCIKGVELQPEGERNITIHEIRERTSESIREHERRRDMLSTSLCCQLRLCYRHLESLVCSSMNIALESTAELCERTSLDTFIPVNMRYCTAVSNPGIFTDNWTPLASETRDKYTIDIGTSPCVTIWFVRQSKLYIILYVHPWVYAYCIPSPPLSMINLFTIIYIILFIIQNPSSFQFHCNPVQACYFGNYHTSFCLCYHSAFGVHKIYLPVISPP